MNNEQPDIKKFPYMKYIIGLLFLLIVIKSQAQYDYVINFNNARHYDLFNRVTWEGKTYKDIVIYFYQGVAISNLSSFNDLLAKK